MKARTLLTIFFLALAAACAQTQTPSGSGAGAGAGGSNGTLGGTIVAETVVLSNGIQFAQGVKGVPMSADVITEFNQVLTDGNRIHRETHGKIYRDAEGRTRSETEEEPLAPGAEIRRQILINDPVQGVTIILNPMNKTGLLRHFSPLPQHPPAVPEAPKPPASDADSGKATPGTRPLPTTSKPEELGTMQIEGFTATGTRRTHTLAAGAIGNERPIVSVSESWFSPELKTTLLWKQDNPQSGQRISKVVNIQTAAPDPLLFQAPADYTVKEPPARQSR